MTDATAPLPKTKPDGNYGTREAEEALDFALALYRALLGKSEGEGQDRPDSILEGLWRLSTVSEELFQAWDGIGLALQELGDLSPAEFDSLFGDRLGELAYLILQDLLPATTAGAAPERGTRETEEFLDAVLALYEDLEASPLLGSFLGLLLRGRKHFARIQRGLAGWQDILPELADLSPEEFQRVYRHRLAKLAYFLYRDLGGSQALRGKLGNAFQPLPADDDDDDDEHPEPLPDTGEPRNGSAKPLRATPLGTLEWAGNGADA